MTILWTRCGIYCSKTFPLRGTSTRKLPRHGLNQEDASVPLGSDHSFADETQTIGFGTQPNAALNSQEVLETDNEFVRESIESAHVDSLTTTQESSLSNTNNEEKEIMIDSPAPTRSSRTPRGASHSLYTLAAA